MSVMLITGGMVVDPSAGVERIGDVWIVDGLIADPQQAFRLTPDQTIDARGKLVFPGLIDMNVHLREPGLERHETIATGAAAAVESGITTLVAMPATEPPLDNQSAIEFVVLQADRAGKARVVPVGCATKNRSGEELAEMGAMVKGGAVAFGDSDRSIASAEMMRRVLEYSKMFDVPIFSHPEASELTKGGVMNEGFYSMRLGLPGMPSIAETIFVERDIELADFTGGRLHVQNVTCGGSVESIRQAKKRGVRVTCEVAVHHLVLTDEVMAGYSAVYKVNPPLRTEDDRRALIEGLKDGTIDAIVSGHAPIATEDKQRELDQSPFGMIGIESLLPIVVKRLIDPGELNWLDAIRLMSTRPAEILKLNGGSLQPGARADLVVYDANVEWTIDPTKFRSKSRNCPFAGEQVRGRPAAVLINGEICQLA